MGVPEDVTAALTEISAARERITAARGPGLIRTEGTVIIKKFRVGKVKGIGGDLVSVAPGGTFTSDDMSVELVEFARSPDADAALARLDELEATLRTISAGQAEPANVSGAKAILTTLAPALLSLIPTVVQVFTSLPHP